MTQRRRSREIAIQLLYKLDFDPTTNTGVMFRDYLDSFGAPQDDVEYSKSLVETVSSHLMDIDSKIQSQSQHWKVSRMAAVDRNILRMAVAEMFYLSVPPKATINEAVELAKLFSTAESAGFVNGILDQMAKKARLID